MKRIPIILAVLTAVLLTLCFLEYGFRGLNPDVESDWVSHPAWWQSDFLADIGFFLRWYAAMATGSFERFLGGSFRASFVVCVLFQLLMIAVGSFVVLYLARLLVRLPGLAMRSGR